MIILQELQEIMARLQENIDSATNELLRCPTGKISTLETNGRYIVYQYFMYKGKRKRKTITNDDEMMHIPGNRHDRSEGTACDSASSGKVPLSYFF